MVIYADEIRSCPRVPNITVYKTNLRSCDSWAESISAVVEKKNKQATTLEWP